MSESPVTYDLHRASESEAEIAALANVYRFVLDCHTKKEAAPESRPDDARKDQDAGTYTHCT